MWHEAKAFAQRRAIEQHELWCAPPLDADGLPVLLVGGLCSTPYLLSPMQDLLHRMNCRVLVAPIRFGVGCGEATAAGVERALERLASATSQRVVMIGHSRGGQFARAVTVRRPELVRGLVTLGSPLTSLLAVSPALRLQVMLIGLAGGLGVPGLMRPGCLWGACCAPLRADLGAHFPESVPFLSVYSREDRMVDWRSSQDPAARHREVTSGHGGLIWEPEPLAVVVGELAAVLGTRLAPVSAGTVEPGRNDWDRIAA